MKEFQTTLKPANDALQLGLHNWATAFEIGTDILVLSIGENLLMIVETEAHNVISFRRKE